MRKYHKGVGADGFAALPDRPIPGRPLTLRRADLDALRHLLDAAAARGETWMTPCLRHWLATTRGERRSTRSIYDHTKAAHFSGQEPLVEQACAA